MAVMVWHMKFIFLAKITRQSKLAALKIETEQPPRFNNVKNELDIFNACSELVISKKCINFLKRSRNRRIKLDVFFESCCLYNSLSG